MINVIYNNSWEIVNLLISFMFKINKSLLANQKLNILFFSHCGRLEKSLLGGSKVLIIAAGIIRGYTVYLYQENTMAYGY